MSIAQFMGSAGLMASDTADRNDVITLPANLGQDKTEGLLATLQAAAAGDGPIRIDASNIESIALPCVQILLSASKAGLPVTIVNPSTYFSDRIQGLAVGDYLSCTEGTNCGEAPSASNAPSNVIPLHDAEPSRETNTVPVSEPEREPEPEPEPRATVTKRILTIDDSKTMRDMLMLTLSSSGFDVLQAVDGRDGLDVLEKENVDVVITDINMPKMDGYGVIQHLRSDQKYDATPILVLTTESDQEKKQRARELGATGFIVKPFNPESLIDVVRKVSP